MMRLTRPPTKEEVLDNFLTDPSVLMHLRAWAYNQINISLDVELEKTLDNGLLDALKHQIFLAESHEVESGEDPDVVAEEMETYFEEHG